MLIYTFNFSKNKRYSEHHYNRKLKVVLMMMIAFITFKSSLVPLLEGL